jgi:peptidoglycan/LPS O-acetylase OafA/YrhL
MNIDLGAAVRQQRDNHFNLIRFIAAALVLYSHSYPLAGHAVEEPLHAFGISFGQVAVAIFFVASGFLVTGSLQRARSIWVFFRARLLRIYPGLIVANLITVFGIGLWFTSLPHADYIAHGDVYRYLHRNSLLLFNPVQYRLPGVFEQNTYPAVVNGSLWTLPREVKLYLQLGLLGGTLVWLARWRSVALRFALLPVVLGFAVAVLTSPGAIEGHVYTRAELSLLFFAGALVYAWRDHIRLDWRISLGVVLVVLITAVVQPSPSLLRLILIPVLVWLVPLLAYQRARPLLAFNRLGDYSYGLYVYAFPVQQAVAAIAPSLSPWALSGAALPLTLVLAVLSWHVIEKPALRFKRSRADRRSIAGSAKAPPDLPL